MNSFSLAGSLSVSVRVYRAMLAAYPKKFREHYGTQMVQVFRDSYRDAYRHNGLSGLIDLWLRTFADLLVTALKERIMERSQVMFSPKVILWGGLASLFGGLFWILGGLAADGSATALLGLILVLGGLAGLYSRQAGQGERLGLAGLVLGSIGTGLVLAALWWASASGRFSNIERDPALGAAPFLIFSLELLILGVGLILLSVTSLRGKTLNRWRGLPLGLGLLHTLGGVAFWLVYYWPLSQGRNPWHQWSLIGGHVVYHGLLWPGLAVLLGVGWMGLGILLTAEANAQVAQPPEASAETR